MSEAHTRYRQRVCDRLTILLRQHGTCPYLPDTPEHERWMREKDSLAAKAHDEAANEWRIERDRIDYNDLPPMDWHPLGFAYRTQRHDWPEIWPPRLTIFKEAKP